jgi:hypothetical protein
MNLYAYVGGDPVSYRDPSGNCGLTDYIVGFGDSFLIPKLIRGAFDISGDVDYEGGLYNAGEIGGTIWGIIPLGLESAVFKSQFFRIGPGRMKALPPEFGLPALPKGPGAQRMRFGPNERGVTSPESNYVDLRNRLPTPLPLGSLTSQPSNGTGNSCP